MRAARAFSDALEDAGMLDAVTRVHVTLYGSLGSTGIGHGTPDAVVAGLAGERPETCDPDAVRGSWSHLPAAVDPGTTERGAAGSDETEPGRVLLNGRHPITMFRDDIAFEPRTRLPGHPNALRLTAWTLDDTRPALEQVYYSIGGGFIRLDGATAPSADRAEHPYPFATSAELIALTDITGLSIDRIALADEESLHGADGIRRGLDAIWSAMAASVTAGLDARGVLPGGLGVRRRAASVRGQLEECDVEGERDTSIEWLHAFALAVNEQNASGGRVVTAPTNGAAGIIPAVGHYYLRFVPGASIDGIHRYLLTATAIGSLFKANASISGAEAGCQGEVGSACAMAAGALCAVLGGTPRQVENAAEIAMEHHLGLTCDPVGGLVQVPCIERNAIAASTAVSAARLALHGDGTHLVSLDTVIETMRQTGLDMSTKYKETSEGGLAVSVPDC
jgi:L-serine dehydratase, iron-sulfur-dependent, single chain form